MQTPPHTANEQVVCILLECILCVVSWIHLICGIVFFCSGRNNSYRESNAICFSCTLYWCIDNRNNLIFGSLIKNNKNMSTNINKVVYMMLQSNLSDTTVRDVLVSMNFGCFSPSRFSHFHCNAMRKAIKTHKNLNTNQQHEHNPGIENKHKSGSDHKFYCKKCDKGFIWNADLNTHLDTHGQKWKCSYKGCNKECSDKCYLNTHMKVHSNELKYPCRKCKERFCFYKQCKHCEANHVWEITGLTVETFFAVPCSLWLVWSE